MVENTPGFRIGGPVLKNKLFIFGSSQWDRIRGDEQGSQITIPTAAGVATLQSLGSNNNVQLLLNSLDGLVAPNATPQSPSAIAPAAAPTAPSKSATFPAKPRKSANSYEYVIRGDYLMTAKDTISVRFLASHKFVDA